MDDVDLSFWHASLDVNAILNMFSLRTALHYGRGTNDNAADAQQEIRLRFDSITSAIENIDNDDEADVLQSLLYENGVMRRPIVFGDPFHIANLYVA